MLSVGPLSTLGMLVLNLWQGSGIGRETALAFAIAGAKQVVLIGRNPGSLAETKEALEHATGSRDAVTVSAFTADVTDVKAMANVALQVGTWDVLVLNAGYIPKPAHVAAADLEDSWLAYEVLCIPSPPVSCILIIEDHSHLLTRKPLLPHSLSSSVEF